MNIIDLTHSEDVTPTPPPTPPQSRAREPAVPPVREEPSRLEKNEESRSPPPPPQSENSSSKTPEPYILPPDVKDRIKRTYDRIGPAYNSVTITIPLRRLEYLDRLLSYVYDSPPGLSAIAADRPIKVLDLGCGSGVPVMEKLLYDGGRFHVVANDISTTQIMLGRALLGGAPGTVDWVESGMMELDFPDDSFDAVMAFYSLFHVPREEQATLFGMIRGWLRPGGYVIMNFPELNQDGFDEDEWYCAKGWMFWSGWGPERTLEKIRAAGLEILVHEMADDDQPFLWVIARKKPEEGEQSKAWNLEDKLEEMRKIQMEYQAKIAALR